MVTVEVAPGTPFNVNVGMAKQQAPPGSELSGPYKITSSETPPASARTNK